MVEIDIKLLKVKMMVRPVETSITLSFKEMDLLQEKEYLRDFNMYFDKNFPVIEYD